MRLVAAVLIFVATYAWLISEKTPRYVVALCGAAAFVLGGFMSLQEALQQVNWDTIALVFGMFCIVSALAEAGFFEWMGLSVARRLGYSPAKIFFAFPVLAAALSMVLDNITVMLFMTALTLEICAYVDTNPVVLIVMEVCAANTGGGATLLGAPPNIVMGTTLGYGFNQFLAHMALPAWLCTGVLMAVFYISERVPLSQSHPHGRDHWDASSEVEKIKDRGLLKGGLVALGSALVLMMLHPLFTRLGLPVSIGLAALVPALGLLVFLDRHGRQVLKKIDFDTLLFFMGLFVIMGGLRKAEVFDLVDRKLLQVCGDGGGLMLGILWLAAILSAFVDNVPMALSMAYLIQGLDGLPGAPPQSMLVWSALMGLLLGGNMTPIGASPNVVAYGILEERGTRVGWARWARMTVPATLSALAAASAFMWFKWKIGWY